MRENFFIDDIEIHIDGEGEETMLMIHGWPDSHRLWDATVAAFESHYRCARFTLPGFDPTMPRRAYSINELMHFMERVVQRLSPDKPVILVLHDWGCVFGYEFYMRNKNRVSKIIATDVGDTVSMRKSIQLPAALMVFTYQSILALAWRVGAF